MGKIKVLDEQLANQIAAGEVVERPSSVVKELVENAIDAGSSAIDVQVEEGGLTLIRVTDNGSGIEPDDLETAFQRHATSKLLTSRDLFRIASLGFRGEALPSIAAVARVECVSSTGDGGLGKRLSIEGGAVRAFENANAPQGTDMTVRDLFYNTPARLKYMKSIQTELGHISDYMNRLSLAHPGIAFTLKHNGNKLLRTLGNGDRLQVIAAVYGTNTAKGMIPVSGDHPDYQLLGFISKPELTKANRNGITAIVNGRYIRSFVINQAILQAFHTLLPINRYPLAVLEIGMHPGLVDVNVHPSKMEVRFSKEPELKSFIEETLRAALGGRVHIPSGAPQDRTRPVFVQERISFHQPEPEFPPHARAADEHPGDGNRPASTAAAAAERLPWSRGTDTFDKGRDKRADIPPLPSVPPDAAEKLYAPPGKLQADWAIRESSAALEAAGHPEQAQTAALPERTPAPGETVKPVEPADKPEEKEKGRFPELSWIGQLHGTYFVAQNEDGLYLVDQHAAHERINYEYYLRKFGEPAPYTQPLLVPLTLEFTAGEAELVRSRLQAFAEAGVELEPFGLNAFLVRAHPEWLPKGEEQAIIEEMAEWILSEKKAVDIAKLREKAAIMCSCKASIKANDRMTREEGEALLRRLAACGQPYTCPHGRPIVVHISTYQLEKMFKRVMS